MAQDCASAKSGTPLVKPVWWPYKRSNTDDLNVNFGSEKSRYHVVNAPPHTPFVAHPPYAKFNAPVHGELTLAYGAINEFNEQIRVLQAIQQDEHVCHMVTIHKLTLMVVKFSSPPRIGFGPEEKYSLPDNSAMTVKLRSDAATEEIEVRGVSIDNEYSIPQADITVLITGADAEKLKSSSSWYRKHGMKSDRKFRCKKTPSAKPKLTR